MLVTVAVVVVQVQRAVQQVAQVLVQAYQVQVVMVRKMLSVQVPTYTMPVVVQEVDGEQEA
tara:strand:- start:42 stop:224 length:183 start_codon:yes stop_codon:yes gene_type:complete